MIRAKRDGAVNRLDRVKMFALPKTQPGQGNPHIGVIGRQPSGTSDKSISISKPTNSDRRARFIQKALGLRGKRCRLGIGRTCFAR